MEVKKSLVRSLFEYVSVIKSCMHPSALNQLQAIQKTAMRVILNKPFDKIRLKHVPNEELSRLSGLPPVAVRLDELAERYLSNAEKKNNPIVAECIKEFERDMLHVPRSKISPTDQWLEKRKNSKQQGISHRTCHVTFIFLGPKIFKIIIILLALTLDLCFVYAINSIKISEQVTSLLCLKRGRSLAKTIKSVVDAIRSLHFTSLVRLKQSSPQVLKNDADVSSSHQVAFALMLSTAQFFLCLFQLTLFITYYLVFWFNSCCLKFHFQIFY